MSSESELDKIKRLYLLGLSLEEIRKNVEFVFAQPMLEGIISYYSDDWNKYKEFDFEF